MKSYSSHYDVCHAFSRDPFDKRGGKASNMFFGDGKLYSYGRHFVIARAFESTVKIAFTTSDYSVSTSKHISRARSALSHYNKVFVPDPSINASRNFNDVITSAEHNLKKASSARQRKNDYLSSASFAIKNLLEYNKIKEVKSLTAKEKNKLKKMLELIETFDNSKYKERLQEAKKKEAKRKAQEVKKSVAKFRKFETRSVNSDKVFLRYNKENDTVETSKGYSIKAEIAQRFYSLWRAGKATGEYLDGFRCTHANSNSIRIGCHHIEEPEISNFAKLMNWI